VILGSLHAFEADHMAAVTSFVVQRPRPRDALRFGLQWALGHGGAILLAGALLMLVGATIPESATGVMERLVGVALVALGVSTAWAAHRAHIRSHIHTSTSSRTRAPAAIGLMHGLAGAAPAVALIPLAVMDSTAQGLGYLLLFTLGTAASMSAYAMTAGYFVARASVSEHAGSHIGRLTGLTTIAIGLFWLIR
jgi:nickel/cobalt transporter (NicO) family protein